MYICLEFFEDLDWSLCSHHCFVEQNWILVETSKVMRLRRKNIFVPTPPSWLKSRWQQCLMCVGKSDKFDDGGFVRVRTFEQRE
jgi:hypothetical protein